MYRDSGMRGDAVSEHVVKGAASILNEGGFASVLINWHHRNEDDWDLRPREWFKKLGCDCWLVRSGVSSPLAYAASWLRFNEARNPERYGQLLDEWLAYYARVGVESICAGAVVMRKRGASSNWVRCDTVDNVQGSGQCSESIQRVFAAEDYLLGFSEDTQLMDQRMLLHPQVTAEQHLAVRDGSWSIESLVLNVSEGFPFAGKADVHIMKLLAYCDGKRTVRAAIRGLADSLETPFDSLAPSCLGVIKKMIRSGMLTWGEGT
jgi:hypothetical protein